MVGVVQIPIPGQSKQENQKSIFFIIPIEVCVVKISISEHL